VHSFLLLLTLFGISLFGQIESSYKRPDLRRNFYLAAENKETCAALVAHLNKYQGPDPVVYGYKAATQGIMADQAWNPYLKIKYVRTAAKLFEEIIRKNSQQTEVRFLRYSLEYYIPRYLNMSGHLQEDQAIILRSLFNYPQSDLDPEIFGIVRKFLLKHPEELTAQERKQIANIKA